MYSGFEFQLTSLSVPIKTVELGEADSRRNIRFEAGRHVKEKNGMNASKGKKDYHYALCCQTTWDMFFFLLSLLFSFYPFSLSALMLTSCTNALLNS